MMETMDAFLKFNPVSKTRMNIELTGSWITGKPLPEAQHVSDQLLSYDGIGVVHLRANQLEDWDSQLLVFLSRLLSTCEHQDISISKEGLPSGVLRLLALAAAVPEKKGAKRERSRPSFLVHVGYDALSFARSTTEIFTFLGGAVVAFFRLFSGKASFRISDLWRIVQECGANALPIVSLISLLVGLILAFVGAVQLKLFGAEIYVADLVGIAMVRVMGAVMTGIIMAGRTGAAFAAQIGTMEVNEEIDALRTLGINPMEFLVLPRMMGLTLMMPLLCLYSNLMGILGGMIVGIGMLDLNLMQYYMQTCQAVSLNDLWIGLFQGAVFGILVALTGCLRGMQCKRSAAAVGDAATSAVVTGIVGIIVTTALVTIVCNVLGI
ncbi:MAG: ABC transporter permease [Desulfobacterales bacterium]|nr:ABC transporter permease [Desulfobacterales bacterium]